MVHYSFQVWEHKRNTVALVHQFLTYENAMLRKIGNLKSYTQIENLFSQPRFHNYYPSLGGGQ